MATKKWMTSLRQLRGWRLTPTSAAVLVGLMLSGAFAGGSQAVGVRPVPANTRVAQQGSAPPQAQPAAATGAAAVGGSCTNLPALPSAPPSRNVVKVTDFGAKPNDDTDDTAGIQLALDALKPGQWLVFPPGRYLHDS